MQSINWDRTEYWYHVSHYQSLYIRFYMNSAPSIKIAKESLLSCRTTGVNGVGMFARQQVIAHPVYCALTALTAWQKMSIKRCYMWKSGHTNNLPWCYNISYLGPARWEIGVQLWRGFARRKHGYSNNDRIIRCNSERKRSMDPILKVSGSFIDAI